ncbi:hypothetical protein Bbelb_117390 [Branchiostoma belcheri]|nr:hypothetical protein Bbelb_117390 [Branchiostoma belcheri]
MAEKVPSNAVTKTSNRPANNDANHSLQPRAVTSLKQDNETASTTVSEHNKDNPCIQPYAVAYLEHDGTVVESANCDDVQPYAVRYQKGEDNVVELDYVNDDIDPRMQPSADRYEGDEGASPRNVNCDIIQPHAPYAVAYVDHDDVACRTASGANPLASNRDSDVSSNPLGSDPNVPNQMNVPNVQQPKARGRTRHQRVYLAIKTAALLGLCIVISVISLWLYFSTSKPQLVSLYALTYCITLSL